MKSHKLRIAWSVVWCIACLALSSACFVSQYRGTDLYLLQRGGPGLKSIAVHSGRIWLSWEPRAPYRPKWAGQTNHYGFRYNMYSSGTWNVSAPAWVVGVLFATTGATLAAAPWLRSIHYRFSLRTLLIVTTLVAIVLGLMVWTAH